MNNIKSIFYIFILITSFSCSSNKKFQSIEIKTKLNEIWILHSMQKEPYNKSSDKHPYLEIIIGEEKFYGNDGCNQITGSIKELTNKTIRFTGVVGTRMYCPNIEITNKFLNLLQNTSYYTIQNLRLILLDSNKNKLLIFTKAD